ncbi:uncharacterized protein LDX57_000561 [Aspergillus melleus]|uniref:uncharacterized protein n=1 Tax=Aspergillus melleus TaxID=138277 RepID=UPI001E8DE55E|nr:uncharacterized protein LDX57_000561 [Aspergillus melleus]KAH8422806.1 hypothetical protein LDX57_000561 [Aspergillus melleus]
MACNHSNGRRLENHGRHLQTPDRRHQHKTHRAHAGAAQRPYPFLAGFPGINCDAGFDACVCGTAQGEIPAEKLTGGGNVVHVEVGVGIGLDVSLREVQDGTGHDLLVGSQNQPLARSVKFHLYFVCLGYPPS